FAEISGLLEQAGALVEVADAGAMAGQINGWLSDRSAARVAGEAGQGVVEANQGALERLLEGIARRL
ncbi:MAG: 3-deoxy-D-manno-octulosonic acid transferase, partial [Pseudomonas sp.]